MQCYSFVDVGLLGSAKSCVDSQSEKSVVTDSRELFDQMIEQLIQNIMNRKLCSVQIIRFVEEVFSYI